MSRQFSVAPVRHTSAVAALGAQLQLAVGRNELELHFQPEVDLGTGDVTDMEGLLRWAHPERGLLWPADFLPVAEQLGLLPRLGQWVLERAAAEAATWPAGHRCWVNASPAELLDPSFPARVAAAIRSAGLAPGTLGIDLPEGALLALGHEAGRVCSELRAAGAVLALEHRGHGPALRLPLADLGIAVVKVSRALVRGIDVDDDRRKDVDVLVRSAAAMGAQVIAVGVESWPEAQHLRRLGVFRGHGFLFAPPQRADRAKWLLSRRDLGRGSYLHDGGQWLQAGQFAAGLHDALPTRHDTPVSRAASLFRGRRIAAASPVAQAAPIKVAPMGASGRVAAAQGADPFGRHSARPAPKPEAIRPRVADGGFFSNGYTAP